MCGIIGFLGINKNSFNILLNGLKQLQNRGYDSAGICSINKSEFIINKYASDKKMNAIEKLSKYKNRHLNNIGIGHTRWATHGPKTDINSHPHIDFFNTFSLVHNGIIENYESLKLDLLKKGYKFESQTDSEIIVNLLHYNWINNNKNIELSINITVKKLEGTFALCILNKFEKNKIYCIRKGSPLLISNNKEFAIVASEQSGFDGMVNNYINLNNNDLCVISLINNKIQIETINNYEEIKISIKNDLTLSNEFKHWTIKEIYEQTESSKRAISFGGRLFNNKIKLGGLSNHSDILKDIDNIILLGCGTSYFAGMIGSKYFKELCNFNTVNLFDGAEFDKCDIPHFGKTALIFLSQSGETKDLHRCIDIGKKNNLIMIGIINVVDSMIAREVNCGTYLNAGREVGVASTKSFTSQCIVLSMLAIWFSQIHNVNDIKRIKYISDLRRLSMDIEYTIDQTENKCKEIANLLKDNTSLFILGKNKSEAIAKEGALKIKEISYIHAEGYSGSSLKHGPFGLLEEDFPVILIDPNDNYHSKMNNVYEEIKSRNAKIISITNDKSMLNKRKNVILVPNNESFVEILSIIPIQLLAYNLSINKDINPDFPRNLAKCVTTE